MIEQALSYSGQPIAGIEISQGLADPAFFWDSEVVELRDQLTKYINENNLEGKNEHRKTNSTY